MGNKREKLFDIRFGNDFLDITQNTQAIKAKVHKWEYIHLKSFCTTKKTVNREQRQPTEWRKYL